MQRQRLRFLIETGSGALSAILLILALVVPDWIERMFAVAPDGGNGSDEWVVVVLGAAMLASFLEAGRTWWRWWRAASA
jgi:hypothetical protein